MAKPVDRGYRQGEPRPRRSTGEDWTRQKAKLRRNCRKTSRDRERDQKQRPEDPNQQRPESTRGRAAERKSRSRTDMGLQQLRCDLTLLRRQERRGTLVVVQHNRSGMLQKGTPRMSTHRTVIKHKVGLLRLLGNVSQACKDESLVQALLGLGAQRIRESSQQDNNLVASIRSLADESGVVRRLSGLNVPHDHSPAGPRAVIVRIAAVIQNLFRQGIEPRNHVGGKYLLLQ